MKSTVLIFSLLLFLAGCATYKELTPSPELLPLERGYIELKNDKDNFQLEKDKKYFIAFPGPHKADFVLVLRLDGKRFLGTALSRTPPGESGGLQRIPDELPGSDTLCLYGLDAPPNTFYWVIDTVQMDLELLMRYRYVPRWRFTYEQRYPAVQNGLAGNRVDRTLYNSIDSRSSLSGINFTQELVNLDVRTRNLGVLRDDLVKLGGLFPREVIEAKDSTYQKYLALKENVDEELQFQQTYALVLSAFQKERESEGNVQKFLDAAPSFTDFMKHRESIRTPIVDRARDIFLDRLSQVFPYYDRQLRSKSDVTRLKIQPSLANAEKLYEACDQRAPAELQRLSQFVLRYNVEADALLDAQNKLGELDRLTAKNMDWRSDTLYGTLFAKAQGVKELLPESQIGRFAGYADYPFVNSLGEGIRNAQREATAYATLYDASRTSLREINAQQWGSAEMDLRTQFESQEYKDIAARDAQKHLIINQLENDMVSRIRSISQQRADAFAAKHTLTTDNVPGLYADSAFLPVYQLTFSSGGPTQLAKNRASIQEYLDNIRTVRFPETAIKALYSDLTQAMNVRGVEKARAIVDHGKIYKGTDKQVRAIVDECDPNIAKWIVRAKDYRRVLALPLTNNRQGSNEYLFRIGLKIPSEAQFPVFDINIKLPREVAEKASKEQWFTEMTINKTPIRNEGRYRITSPTPENNYESQITPVQMDKEGNNVLEVKFRYPGFRVFEVSAMAQVPIIRKN